MSRLILSEETQKRIMLEEEKKHDAEMLRKKKELQSDWWPLDKGPDEDCPFCLRSGYVGHFKNGKIVPCRCCYLANDNWLCGYHKQAIEYKSTTDPIMKGLCRGFKRKKNNKPKRPKIMMIKESSSEPEKE